MPTVAAQPALGRSLLDPRTKLLLLILLPGFLLSGAGGEYFRPVRLFLSLLPLILLMVSGNPRKALRGVFILLTVHGLWVAVAPKLPPVGYMLLMIFHGLLVHLVPCLLLGAYVLTSTTVSEFIAGMQKLGISDLVIIPMSVIFRFFPTVLEEIRAIRRAMGMRGIRLGRTPAHRWFEYRLVPTMICSLRIGDELSAAALSRGLGGPTPRTSICRVAFGFWDGVVWVVSGALLLLWILGLCGVRLW